MIPLASHYCSDITRWGHYIYMIYYNSVITHPELVSTCLHVFARYGRWFMAKIFVSGDERPSSCKACPEQAGNVMGKSSMNVNSMDCMDIIVIIWDIIDVHRIPMGIYEIYEAWNWCGDIYLHHSTDQDVVIRINNQKPWESMGTTNT